MRASTPLPLELAFRGDSRLNGGLPWRDVERIAVKRVVDYGEYRDVVYNYKRIEQNVYFRIPATALFRGSVLRVYNNGEARQVAFPFAKFFNVNETSATRVDALPRERFIATEKLDGTLVIVWVDPDTGELRFNTRGMLDRMDLGAVDRGRVVNPFVVRFIRAVRRMGLWGELEGLAGEGRTLMFELLYKVPASSGFNVYRTRVDDPSWTPYLLAYRDHGSMEIVYRVETSFPRPRIHNVSTLEEALNVVSEDTEHEGMVIHYPGRGYMGFKWWSFMVKAKNPVYLAAVSKTYNIDSIVPLKLKWKKLARLVLEGKGDDLLSIETMDSESRQFIVEVMRAVSMIEIAWSTLTSRYAGLVESSEYARRKLAENGYGYMIRYMTKQRGRFVENMAKTILKSTNSHEKFIEKLYKLIDHIDKAMIILSTVAASRHTLRDAARHQSNRDNGLHTQQ